MTHTKGPWIIGQQRRDGSYPIKCKKGNIAVVSSVSMDYAHNARLIAAAPELLEALELAIATIERLANTPARTASVQGTLSVANEAIQKAGES